MQMNNEVIEQLIRSIFNTDFAKAEEEIMSCVHAKTQAKTVAHLERALDMAKKGELHSVFLVGLNNDSHIRATTCSSFDINRMTDAVIGNLERLHDCK